MSATESGTGAVTAPAADQGKGCGLTEAKALARLIDARLFEHAQVAPEREGDPWTCSCGGWVGGLFSVHVRDALVERILADRAARRDEGEAAVAAVERVRSVLDEWGALYDADDFDADNFAEAIRDSGAWRLARDLHRALDGGPS